MDEMRPGGEIAGSSPGATLPRELGTGVYILPWSVPHGHTL